MKKYIIPRTEQEQIRILCVICNTSGSNTPESSPTTEGEPNSICGRKLYV